jgi:L-threonylcarbamoyladenylate synthase
MIPPLVLREAVAALEAGGLIAYPTEGVWGVGCDPMNPRACSRLLALKRRAFGKGLIVVAADFEQVEPMLRMVDERIEQRALATWPGPVTWLWPAEDWVPDWLTGRRQRLAVRVSAHPVVRALCDAWGGPIVSTSANRSGLPPARNRVQVQRWLGRDLDVIVPGDTGGLEGPTPIRDLLTGLTARP